MLDPYYRVPLLPASTSSNYTTYTASFKIPDQHGVFAFGVSYERPYLAYIDEKYSFTVRHFASIQVQEELCKLLSLVPKFYPTLREDWRRVRREVSGAKKFSSL